MDTITLLRPDDWHVHLRDGEPMRAVVPFTAARFGRAIVMPNLKPPVTSTELAVAYRRRIADALPEDASFEPLMTVYLTDYTPVAEVERAKASGAVYGFKWYPAGATTHSDAGVTDPRKIEAVLSRMSDLGVVLQVHGESVDPKVDIFDREARFIEKVLQPVSEQFPKLRIVLEHITTRTAVEFVRGARRGIAATITAHHLHLTRNALLVGGIQPHHYCLPVVKTERDRAALVKAATSGEERFFLGTDSAPHPRYLKQSACGPAGIFSAHAGIELYAEIFENAGALDKLEGFASRFGAKFYGLPLARESITLTREPWLVPGAYPFGVDELVPFRAGEQLAWRLAK